MMSSLFIRQNRISIDSKVNGKPTIRGKQITVHTILNLISAGESIREILHQHPSLEVENIPACLATFHYGQMMRKSILPTLMTRRGFAC